MLMMQFVWSSHMLHQSGTKRINQSQTSFRSTRWYNVPLVLVPAPVGWKKTENHIKHMLIQQMLCLSAGPYSLAVDSTRWQDFQFHQEMQKLNHMRWTWWVAVISAYEIEAQYAWIQSSCQVYHFANSKFLHYTRWNVLLALNNYVDIMWKQQVNVTKIKLAPTIQGISVWWFKIQRLLTFLFS